MGWNPPTAGAGDVGTFVVTPPVTTVFPANIPAFNVLGWIEAAGVAGM